VNELTTRHRGQHIRYSENEDVWRCYELDLDAPKLSLLKTKINKALKDAAAETNQRVLNVYEYGSDWYAAVVVSRDKKGYCWVSRTDDKGQVRRSKVRVADLIADTPTNRASLAEYDRLRSEANSLLRRADEAKTGLVRLTEDDILLPPI
jgi:hypothetical protein